MAGIAARAAQNAAVRLRAMISSQRSSGNASTGATCWTPRAVDEDVQGTELGLAGSDEGVGRIRPPQIRGDVAGLSRRESVLQLTPLIAAPVEDDAAARGGERLGNSESDAAG